MPKKMTQVSDGAVPIASDILLVTRAPGSVPASKKITIANFAKSPGFGAGVRVNDFQLTAPGADPYLAPLTGTFSDLTTFFSRMSQIGSLVFWRFGFIVTPSNADGGLNISLPNTMLMIMDDRGTWEFPGGYIQIGTSRVPANFFAVDPGTFELDTFDGSLMVPTAPAVIAGSIWFEVQV